MRSLRPLPVTRAEERPEIHVLEVEPGGLRDSHACRVEKLEERAVPLRKRALLLGVEQALGVRERQRAGQRLRHARRRNALGGVLVAMALAAGPLEERAQGREVPRDRAVDELPAVERREVRAHRERVDSGKRRLAGRLVGELALPERGEAVEVRAVRPDRLRGEAPFVGQVALEPVDRARERDHGISVRPGATSWARSRGRRS